MTTHSIVLAWRTPWTEELGGLYSMGLQRVGHDRCDLAHTHTHEFEIKARYFDEHFWWRVRDTCGFGTADLSIK